MVTDLKGVGGANKAEQLMASLANYVVHSVLIIDEEGDVPRIVERLVDEGWIDRADVLKVSPNLEERNFTPAELVAAAIEVAATPSSKREAATSALTEQDLREAHDKQVAAATGSDVPGMAGTLEKLTRNPAYGPAPVTEVEHAERLAQIHAHRARPSQD